MTSVVSVSSIAAFFGEESQLIERGENSLSSSRMEKFSYSPETYHILAKVHASMRDKSYTVEIDLTADGKVERASCDCPKGMYRCHHMAVPLLHAQKSVSKTDGECQWSKKKNKADEETRSIDEMYPPRKPFKATDRPVTAEDRDEFLASLKTSGRPRGFVWLLSRSSQPEQPSLPIVQEIVRSEGFSTAQDPTAFVLSKLSLTDGQRVEVAGKSIGQRSNPTWGLFHKGRVTASNFGPVLKAAKSARQPSKSLMKSLLGSYDGSGARAIQWGVMHESTAISCFEMACDVSVQQTGIWLSASGMLGASPDGLVGDNAIIEVKCPYSARTTPLATLAGPKFYLKIVEGAFCLNTEDSTGFNYYNQIQGNLHLTGREVCHFVVWTPSETQVVRVSKEPGWQENITLLEQFYQKHFLPEFICAVLA